MKDTTTYQEIHLKLKKISKLSSSNPARFFKTEAGSYAAHDQFIGVSTPILRKLSKEISYLPQKEFQKLLSSKINEERLLALFLLINNYNQIDDDKKIDNAKKIDNYNSIKDRNYNGNNNRNYRSKNIDKTMNKIMNKTMDKQLCFYSKKEIYQYYLKNIQHINNWNLVDASAHLIVGKFLGSETKKKSDESTLKKLAKSNNMWERRIAMVATWHFIRQNQHHLTLKIAEQLLQDTEDLIHKAVGWMLREVGKKDLKELIRFLNQYATIMPRTMLRYAIERLPLIKRKHYLGLRNY